MTISNIRLFAIGGFGISGEKFATFADRHGQGSVRQRVRTISGEVVREYVRKCVPNDYWISNCLSPDRKAPSWSRRTTAGVDGAKRVSDRDSTKTIMAEPTKRKKWSDVKARLEAFDRKGLVSLLGDLYDASVANRRFLHSRLTPGSRAIEEYRRLVADAIYPDPFSKRRVSVRDAAG